ncbi:hypothetical protein NDA18_006594 [Ustilago nuda]|nr:hypothetical protein NDA18_006594 [Ustilago nuda]
MLKPRQLLKGRIVPFTSSWPSDHVPCLDFCNQAPRLEYVLKHSKHHPPEPLKAHDDVVRELQSIFSSIAPDLIVLPPHTHEYNHFCVLSSHPRSQHRRKRERDMFQEAIKQKSSASPLTPTIKRAVGLNFAQHDRTDSVVRFDGIIPIFPIKSILETLHKRYDVNTIWPVYRPVHERQTGSPQFSGTVYALLPTLEVHCGGLFVQTAKERLIGELIPSKRNDLARLPARNYVQKGHAVEAPSNELLDDTSTVRNTPTLLQKLRPNRTLGIHRLFEAFSSTFGSSAGSTSRQTASDQPPPKKAKAIA